jgi:hypothetical protein
MYCTRVFKIVEYFLMQLKCSEDLDALLLKQWRGFAGRESATSQPSATFTYSILLSLHTVKAIFVSNLEVHIIQAS